MKPITSSILERNLSCKTVVLCWTAGISASLQMLSFSRKSIETENNLLSCITFSVSGNDSPSYHLDIACRDTVNCCDNLSCEKPFCFLKNLSFSPNVILAPPVLYKNLTL